VVTVEDPEVDVVVAEEDVVEETLDGELAPTLALELVSFFSSCSSYSLTSLTPSS